MILGFVGGMDPTGGAGLLRDAWTAASIAPDAELRCVATSLTAQGGRQRASGYPITTESFEDRLAALEDATVLKVGLLPAPLGVTLRAWLQRRAIPVVIDPVLHASDGGALGGSAGSYASCCGPRTILTPNLDEARSFVADLSLEAEALTRAVADATGAGVVLLKGGHQAAAATIVDFMTTDCGVQRIERQRKEGPDIRGTGCALGAAITAYLGRGYEVPDAVVTAVHWLDAARRSARRAPDGRWQLPRA